MARAEGVPLPTPADARTPSKGAALLKRVLTALLFLPVFLAIVMAGPLWVFALMVVVIGAVAQWEFTGMFERAGIRSFRLVGLLAGVAVTSSFALHAAEAGFTAALLAVLAAALGRRDGTRVAWEPVAVTALGDLLRELADRVRDSRFASCPSASSGCCS